MFQEVNQTIALHLLAPVKIAGGIIGKAGATVASIREMSRAKIKLWDSVGVSPIQTVHKKDVSSDRFVDICGDLHAVIFTKNIKTEIINFTSLEVVDFVLVQNLSCYFLNRNLNKKLRLQIWHQNKIILQAPQTFQIIKFCSFVMKLCSVRKLFT